MVKRRLTGSEDTEAVACIGTSKVEIVGMPQEESVNAFAERRQKSWEAESLSIRIIGVRHRGQSHERLGVAVTSERTTGVMASSLLQRSINSDRRKLASTPK